MTLSNLKPTTHFQDKTLKENMKKVKIGIVSRKLPIDGRYSFKNNEKIVAMKRTRVKERSIGRVSGCPVAMLKVYPFGCDLPLCN